ncbi:esterase-like activity of phytase family protein [soil metagenome]
MLRVTLLLLLSLASSLRAQAVIEASGELPADVRDKFGDTIGGIGSGMVYDAANDTYITVTDRGPGDGAIDFRPRYVVLKIPQTGDKLEPKVVESVLFRDEMGREMTGLVPTDPAADFPHMADGRTCIDPEAIAIAPDGTLYVSEEYGPCLYQFQRDGKMIRRVNLPEEFRPRNEQWGLNFSDTAKLVSGRAVNQGGEGMCLMPDGKSAAIIFQSGLIQDGSDTSPFTHLIVIDLATGALKASYLYPFASRVPLTGAPLKQKHLSVNDLAALDDHRFLVLERDNGGRNGALKHKPALFKSVWIADTSKATNLADSKATTNVPVAKTLVFNLPEIVAAPDNLTAKWESIAPLPSKTPGELELMMGADNDFVTPVLHENGQDVPFPRAEDSLPSQFFKIKVTLPK